jgi:hypothetical protein
MYCVHFLKYFISILFQRKTFSHMNTIVLSGTVDFNPKEKFSKFKSSPIEAYNSFPN